VAEERPIRSATIACPNCGKRNRVPVVASGVPRCAVCHQPLPYIVDATAHDFDRAIESSRLVLIDFWAPWCGPCRFVTPAVERLATSNAGRLKVVKLNIDGAPEIAARYQVQGIPLLVLLEDGGEVDRLVGAAPEPKLREWLRHLPAAAAAG
jgi:thioredoxin 2